MPHFIYYDEPHYLGIDPGDTTGWAAVNSKGQPCNLGAYTFDEMMDYINGYPPDNILGIVMEDFVVFYKKAAKMAGSRHKTIQVIGAVKSYARRHAIPLVMQGSDIKPIAQKWSGIKPEGAHSKSHHIDAFNHVFYYLVKTKRIQPRGE